MNRLKKFNEMNSRTDIKHIGSVNGLGIDKRNIIYDKTIHEFVWNDHLKRIFKIVNTINYHNRVGDTHTPTIQVDVDGFNNLIDIPANKTYGITDLPSNFNYIMYVKKYLSMNKLNLKTEYKTNKEFNSEDYYIFEDWRCFVSKVHLHNGNWYTNESLNFKATSIPCISFGDIKGKRVEYIHKDLKEGEHIYGTVHKCLPPLDLGIDWDQGPKPQRHLPYHWNNINTLRFLG
tara:strand:- start:126051 stop:126746 length:696 start_codon:yes stop_codon:yes gene_type:complete